MTDIRKGKLNKWRPKKWRPEYDRIVAYSAMGKANTWIAATLNFTPEHVSTILNTPQAVDLMGRLQAKLREKIEVNVPEVLGEIAEKAVLRVKEVMFDDDKFEKSPFKVIEIGMEVLKGLNHLKHGNNTQPIGTQVNIGTAVLAPGQKSDILEGLQMVREVKLIHGSNDTSSNGSKER